MPTYDFECPDCGHRFEAFQSMSAKPLKKCPECGKNKVKRLIGSGLQPIFKGSGFYETDYVKKPKSDAAAAASKAETKAESKPDAKPEAKPETKPKADSKPAKAKSE
jgi:putative FmdB family regulatory protein